MREFKDILRELRTEMHLTQQELGEKIDIPTSTIGNYESGSRTQNQSQTMRIAKFFNVSVDYLVGNAKYKNWAEYDAELGEEKLKSLKAEIDFLNSIDFVPIPVLGSIAAGVPIEAQEDRIGTEVVPRKWNGEFFGLVVRGTSMEPTIKDGDTVIVRVQNDIEDDEVGAILIADDVTLKRIRKSPLGITLIGDNFPPKFYSNDEIITLPIKILGKIIEFRRKM